ncbi:Hypothetical_protein [Hexamita inflata]|uniref:Hypothetical_protein n=1 Tax=Hexamita inflata TaxID=28002 RepID=A0AA86PSH0_9EUKA|nr:Hypothetical protein HINF_LOCUS32973 [Hexamita inflata]CAI9945329.1 Hypothetical protein HINF_LOCUS32974 [Hexamita inflata]
MSETRRRFTKEKVELIEQKITEEFNRATGRNCASIKEMVRIYRSSEETPKLDWKRVDEEVGEKSYATKAFSYKQFIDVIVPNNLEQYSPQLLREVEMYLERKLVQKKECIDKITDMEEFNNFKTDIIRDVEERFDLKSPLKPFKKMIDKLRYLITNFVSNHTKCSLNVQRKSEQTENDKPKKRHDIDQSYQRHPVQIQQYKKHSYQSSQSNTYNQQKSHNSAFTPNNYSSLFNFDAGDSNYQSHNQLYQEDMNQLVQSLNNQAKIQEQLTIKNTKILDQVSQISALIKQEECLRKIKQQLQPKETSPDVQSLLETLTQKIM